VIYIDSPYNTKNKDFIYMFFYYRVDIDDKLESVREREVFRIKATGFVG
jgi:adenine specific DNA methylase Mod